MVSSPYFVLILVLYGLGFLCLVVELFIRKTGYILPLVSLAFFVTASIIGLLSGASLFEVALAAAIFLVLSLFGIGRKAR